MFHLTLTVVLIMSCGCALFNIQHQNINQHLFNFSPRLKLLRRWTTWPELRGCWSCRRQKMLESVLFLFILKPEAANEVGREDQLWGHCFCNSDPPWSLWQQNRPVGFQENCKKYLFKHLDYFLCRFMNSENVHCNPEASNYLHVKVTKKLKGYRRIFQIYLNRTYMSQVYFNNL